MRVRRRPGPWRALLGCGAETRHSTGLGQRGKRPRGQSWAAGLERAAQRKRGAGRGRELGLGLLRLEEEGKRVNWACAGGKEAGQGEKREWAAANSAHAGEEEKMAFGPERGRRVFFFSFSKFFFFS